MEKATLVKNEFGMHARPAGVIAKIARTAHDEIWLCANSDKVDATSIIDILTLGAVKGTKVVIEIENHEDVEILNQIIDFFEAGFEEM
ncbi:MAG: HPr family phosphocarrier protein [Deltaproteobacteria bacterium]|jgi:phosphocarrier protein HPr|nr:HPr family phosphocarrier protein [Deltaproteobacteria bacterium]